MPLILRYSWASPNTLLGLALALLARTTGGAWHIHTGVIEAHGGLLAKLLENAPCVPGGALAITFGHCVLARSADAHNLTRTHERIHVRQYERWGPLFIPAYLLASAYAWTRGKDPYRGNPFEIEAYDNS